MRNSPGWPLIVTSFINKSGTIGLYLLPMLLIEKNLSIAESSLILGAVKASLFLGHITGGMSSDRLGLRFTVNSSFLISAIGLAALPFADAAWLILLFGVLAQAGTAMFTSASRILLSELVEKTSFQSALAWLRGTNNLAQVISSFVAYMFSSMGLKFLFLFDATTSFIALLFGAKWMPDSKKHKEQSSQPKLLTILKDPNFWKHQQTKRYFLIISMLFFFFFIYDLSFMGVSAKCKIIWGEKGVQYFTYFNLINAVLCGLLAIPSAKLFQDVKKAFPLGFLLATAGGALALNTENSLIQILIGGFLFSLGEIVFASLSQFVMIEETPPYAKGTFYGFSLVLQSAGRVLGSALMFPMVIAENYSLILLPTCLLFGAISLTAYLKLKAKTTTT